MFAIGIVGLLMTRSLGATTAAVLALGVFGVQTVSARRSQVTRQELVVPTRLLALVVIGLGAAMALRPSNLPMSSKFGESTTVHRSYWRTRDSSSSSSSPLFGIGWQQAPVEVGSPTVSAALHKRFGSGVNPEFIPEGGSAPELHNSYIQVLAETGLIGFLLLIAVLLALGRGIAGILRSVRSNHRLYIAARAAVVLLVVILVWWNDNALYGAQPESVLAATFLGILAATPAVALAGRRDEALDVTA